MARAAPKKHWAIVCPHTPPKPGLRVLVVFSTPVKATPADIQAMARAALGMATLSDIEQATMRVLPIGPGVMRRPDLAEIGLWFGKTGTLRTIGGSSREDRAYTHMLETSKMISSSDRKSRELRKTTESLKAWGNDNLDAQQRTGLWFFLEALKKIEDMS